MRIKTKKRVRHIQKMFPQVKFIKEATESVVVEVTAQDNKRGSVKDPQNCAMARACKRAYNLDGVIISLSKAYLIKGDTAIRYTVPTSLSKEVVAFDRNKQFQPGTYQLSRVAPMEKLGMNYSSPRTTTGEKRGTPKRFIHRTAGVRHFPDRAVLKGE